jgi:hypothetical protein
MYIRQHFNDSNRLIAEHIKVDHKTIAQYKRDLSSTGEIPQSPTSRGADGIERPAQMPRAPTCPDCGGTEFYEDGDCVECYEPPEEQKDKTEEKEPQTDNLEPPANTLRGVGVLRANEAIDRLKQIPRNDRLRKRGFQVVTDWIRHNK